MNTATPDIWTGATGPDAAPPRIVMERRTPPPWLATLWKLDEPDAPYTILRLPVADWQTVVPPDEAWDLFNLAVMAPDARLTRRGAFRSDARRLVIGPDAALALVGYARHAAVLRNDDAARMRADVAALERSLFVMSLEGYRRTLQLAVDRRNLPLGGAVYTRGEAWDTLLCIVRSPGAALSRDGDVQTPRLTDEPAAPACCMDALAVAAVLHGCLAERPGDPFAEWPSP